MIELVFNENAAQALKLIKKQNKSELTIGDIHMLNLHMDLGPLDGLSISDISPRKPILDMIYKHDDPNGIGVSELIYSHNCLTMEALMDRHGTKDAIRMWATENSPSEMTAVCFISNIFRYAANPLITAFVPYRTERDDVVKEIFSTREALEEDFLMVHGSYKVMTKAYRNFCAHTFLRLQSENSAMRIMLNGRLTGADEDFYDSFIISFCPEYPVSVSHLAGKILTEIPALEDRYIINRILHLLDAGIFTAASCGEDIYSLTIRKAKK